MHLLWIEITDELRIARDRSDWRRIAFILVAIARWTLYAPFNTASADRALSAFWSTFRTTGQPKP